MHEEKKSQNFTKGMIFTDSAHKVLMRLRKEHLHRQKVRDLNSNPQFFMFADAQTVGV